MKVCKFTFYESTHVNLLQYMDIREKVMYLKSVLL